MTEQYLISEELNGDGILWVVETVMGGFTPMIDRVYPSGDYSPIGWKFHSRHKSLEDARAVRRALEYDMEHPS